MKPGGNDRQFRRPIAMAIILLLLSGCIGGKTEQTYLIATGGAAVRGKQLITQYNCGSCHTIPGVAGARGVVGPPLFFFSRRTYIAGELPNSPDNLARWIASPQSVEPNTAMPTLGLNEQQARDVAAYLYTLE